MSILKYWFPMLSLLQLAICVQPTLGSIFAGSTSSVIFPPPGIADDGLDTFFPGVLVKLASLDQPQAASIETAPVVAELSNIFPLIEPATANRKSSFDILQYLGNLSPWQSIKSFGLPHASPRVLSGCEIVQVHLLHRHGARYPTTGSAAATFPSKLHAAATSREFSASGALEFLNTWTYKLGVEILTLFWPFSALYTINGLTILHSLYFAAGFFGVQDYQHSYHQLITVKGDDFNNAQPVSVLSMLTKTRSLSARDLFAMQQLCAYETVALGYSAFCGLFTKEEWKGHAYFNDLLFWYVFGPGNPTASAQGIGYVQEFVSHPTQTPIMTFGSSFNSTIVSTIVSNNITFPLNQSLFVDTTHDTASLVICAAMNFTSLAAGGLLSTDQIPQKQTYLSSQIVAFGTNLVG
ncbi:hypothetical protein AX16_006448 [Volvariella volvacea WC 439]|nr:hypothetical protein AX16_006448 [Volvariella volvacea WC 439]